jgi:hypothetical protein
MKSLNEVLWNTNESSETTTTTSNQQIIPQGGNIPGILMCCSVGNGPGGSLCMVGATGCT